MTLRRITGLLAGLLLAASAWTGAWASGNAPALVLVLVIDGLPQEQLVKYRDQYGPGGFRRLLDQGAWFGDAHHGHATTLTGPGHATILTGTYPYRHGIIANDWIDRGTLAQVYCVGDAAHSYLGEPTRKLDGTSPANLRVATVGDELRYANNGQSRVLAISGKDRGAILLAGKRGTAYIYMAGSGRFASSTYYMQAHPEWHARYYAGKPQDRWMGQSWTQLLPEPAYARSLPEGQSWQVPYRGVGVRLPITLPDAVNAAAYYDALIRTSFGNEATLDFARAAVEGEDLGRNLANVSDILAVSLSTHDYVNHGSGPESRLSHDHLLHLDRALASFFDWLDRRVGAERMLIALTSDHGFMNAPEYSAARGLGGARLNSVKMMGDLNEHLAKRFGPGNHALRLSYPTILLDLALIEQKGLKHAEVEAEAARFLARFPGIAAVYTRAQLENGIVPASPLSLSVQRAWHPQLSGELFIVHEPYSLFGSIPVTHGSPWAYDTNVPLALQGARWIKPGKYPRRASVADIAPTLAYLLDIRPPAASEGRVLEEALK